MKRRHLPPPKSNEDPFIEKPAPLILSRFAVFDPFHFFKNLIRMNTQLFQFSWKQTIEAQYEKNGSKMAYA